MNSHSSEILPWLYLGGHRNAENEKELTVRTGITHILNVAHECNMDYRPREVWESYNHERGATSVYKKISWLDLPEQRIDGTLDEALEFIRVAHESHAGNHVLVHCVQGISRSATVVIAYLVRHEGMTLKAAFEHVSKVRTTALPRKEFLHQLVELECSLTGQATSTLDVEKVFAGKNLLNLD